MRRLMRASLCLMISMLAPRAGATTGATLALDGAGDACASPAQPGDLLVQDGPNGRVISWKLLGGDARACGSTGRASRCSLTYLGETQSNKFTDTSADPGEPVRYRVVPLAPLGAEAIESTAAIPAP